MGIGRYLLVRVGRRSEAIDRRYLSFHHYSTRTREVYNSRNNIEIEAKADFSSR